MRSSTLTLLKNKYNSDLGQLEFKQIYTSTDPVVLARHRLNVFTLFEGYKTFLKAKETKEEDYFEFFGDITRKGAPVEAMVCAAVCVDDEVKSESPHNKGAMTLKTCQDWDSNLHLALRFAVIEYLYDHAHHPSRFNKIDWHPIIMTLLALGADPNALSSHYESQLVHFPSTFPAQKRTSAYAIVMAMPTMADQVLDIAREFAEQSIKIKSPLTITAEQALLIFPKPEKNTSLVDNPLFQWLEKNFPHEINEYIQKNSTALITALADNNDYKTIDYFRETFKIKPFSVLVEREEKATPWVDTYSFRYINEKMPDLLVAYMQQNPQLAITRLQIKQLATAGHFDRIDAYRQRFEIDPFDALVAMHYHDAWPRSPIYTYLEDRYSPRLLRHIRDHYAQALNRFSLPELAATNQFAEIEHYRTQYGIDPFPILSECLKQDNSKPWFGSGLYSYLEERFPDKVAAFLEQHTDFLVQKFLTNDDRASLDRIKLDAKGIAIIMRKIFDELKVHCKTAYAYFIEQDFYNHPLFKQLENSNSNGIRQFFLKLDPFQFRQFFEKNEENRVYCAYRHNIDPLVNGYTSILNSDEALVRLKNYYTQRCSFILNFICNQTYPKAAAKRLAKFKLKNKEIIVSEDLHKLLKVLQEAIRPSNFTFKFTCQLYYDVVTKWAPEFLKHNQETQDINERAIYSALASGLNDDSALSQYVHREFLVHRDCVPLLTLLDPKIVKGVMHKPSVPAGKFDVTKDPLFDPKLFGIVFTFLGDYGLKESNQLNTAAAESKECENDDEEQSCSLIFHM